MGIMKSSRSFSHHSGISEVMLHYIVSLTVGFSWKLFKTQQVEWKKKKNTGKQI